MEKGKSKQIYLLIGPPSPVLVLLVVEDGIVSQIQVNMMGESWTLDLKDLMWWYL